jgi:peroxiredoxin Q/BCP
MKIKSLFTVVMASLAVVALQAAETPKVGDTAPLFRGLDQDGKVVQLMDFTGKQAVLLYFYPKDNTPGCTKEACGFRDRLEDLKKQGVAVVGVSRDDVASHKKFATDHGLNFPLLADSNGQITDRFGAGMSERKMSRRISFLIDKNGKIVHVTDHPSADKHLQEMKAAVEKLQAGA